MADDLIEAGLLAVKTDALYLHVNLTTMSLKVVICLLLVRVCIVSALPLA